MKEITTVVLVVACVIGIIAGGIYINKHVDCWNFFGLYKGCAISTVK